jgi:hypothetical protein
MSDASPETRGARAARRLWLGPFLLAGAAAGAKGAYLVSHVEPLDAPRFLAAYAVPEAFLLAVLGLLASAAASLRSRPAALALGGAALGVALVYAADTAVVVSVDHRLSLGALSRFWPEWRAVASFFGAGPALAAALGAALLCVRIRAGTRARVAFAAACGGYALVSVAFAPDPPRALEAYRFRIADLLPATVLADARDPGRYAPDEVAFYRGQAPERAEVRLPVPGSDVILLMVESLSASDSLAVSGLADRLAPLDRLAARGTLFTNFFANYLNTEGGLVAILHGVPPIPFPGGTRELYRSFGMQPSVVGRFAQLGYHTEFLTTANLRFLDKKHYLESLGFDVLRGLEEVPAFRAAPKFAFSAPSDRVLYQELLRRWDELAGLGRPVFLAVITVSSHLPYQDPLGRGDDEATVWDFVAGEIERLVVALEERGFFERGLLVVVGDHRKMTPLSERELARYGESARARVPLLLLGRGAPRGRVDERFFDQADLFRKLADALEPGGALTPHPIWVEDYSQQRRDVSTLNRIVIFDERDGGRRGFAVSLAGPELHWLAEAPAERLGLESRIHAQRAVHQERFRGAATTCAILRDPTPSAPSERAGLRLRIFRGNDLNDGLDSASPRLVASRLVPNVDFREISAGSRVALRFDGYLRVPEDGFYWIRVVSDGGACLTLGDELVVDANYRRGLSGRDRELHLERGLHRLDLRYFPMPEPAGIQLVWRPPGGRKWTLVPDAYLLLSRDAADSAPARARAAR